MVCCPETQDYMGLHTKVMGSLVLYAEVCKSLMVDKHIDQSLGHIGHWHSDSLPTQ